MSFFTQDAGVLQTPVEEENEDPGEMKCLFQLLESVLQLAQHDRALWALSVRPSLLFHPLLVPGSSGCCGHRGAWGS